MARKVIVELVDDYDGKSTAEETVLFGVSGVAYLRSDRYTQVALALTAAQALSPFGVDGRELAVLVVLDAGEPLSQLEAADQLGIDRTTMVALVDALEAKGLVERRRSPQDRRRNLVVLTDNGVDCLRKGERARSAAEDRFLAPLDKAEAEQFLRTLQVLNSAHNNLAT